MKKYLIASAVAIAFAGVANAANAADVSAPAYDWSGFYAGVNAGYAWGETKGTDVNGWTTPWPDALAPTSLTAKGDGLTAGGQIGYNMQFDSFVLGVEGDISYLDVSGSKTSSIYTDNHVVSDDGYLGTLRARLGFTADRLMIYGTAGLALGDTGSKWVDDGGTYQFSRSTGSQWGWVAGAGLEYAATDSISIKAEYLHYDLGTDNVYYGGGPGSYCTPNNSGCNFKMDNSGNIVRAGINFHF